MKTFFFHTLFHGEPDGTKFPVLPLKTAEKFLALASSVLGALLFTSVAINASAQQTDTSIFINMSSHTDTVMHIVWDKIPGGEIYTVEKSEDGNSFSPVSGIGDNALVDMMEIKESPDVFGRILYSTEGGNKRFIYNDIQQAGRDLQYRIRISRGGGVVTYTRAAHYARINNNSDTLGLHDFMQSLQTSSRSVCPPIGIPPSGPCVQPTNIYSTQYLNCCVVTLRRYDLMNCANSYPCTDCVCACSCTTDPCCIHYCYQYLSCSCTPWDPCGIGPQPQWVVESTMPGIPLAVAAPNIQICTGQSATLTATGASTYTWSPSSSLSASTGSSVVATPASTTTYTVTGDLNGCIDSIQVTVVVNSFPVVTVSPADTICFGQSTILTATGASTYSWSPSTALVTSTGSSVSAIPSTTTTYTVTGNLYGCTASAQTTITVNPLPAVTVSPNATVCAGQSAQLTSSGASTYAWSPSSTLSSSTGSNVTALPSSTTTYTVTGSSSNGCTASAQTTIAVNPLPVLTVPNATICTGQSAQLISSGASAYVWSPSSTLSSSTGSSVIASPLSTITYTIIGSLNGCTASAQTIVTVNPLPIVTVSPNATICAGQSTPLTSSGANTYVWSPSSTLSSSTGSSVTASPLSTTTYTVTGNLNGCTASAQTTITVNPLPALIVSLNNTICIGQSAQIISSGANTYTWSPSSTLNSSTGSSVIASPLSTTTYTVTGDLNGCTATAQATVTVNPLPVVTVSPNVTMCAGQSVQLTSSGASTYMWSPALTLNSSAGSSVTATPPITTTYTVTGFLNGCTASAQTTVTVNPLPALIVSPNTTICTGQSTQLISSGANTYSWSPSSTLSSSIGSSVTASPLSTTTYTVTGDLNGCTATAQATVTVSPLPAVTVSPGNTICIGQSAQLISTGASTYVWNPTSTLNSSTGSSVMASPLSTTTYTVIGNLNGCTASAQTTITVNPLPVVTVSPNSAICNGQSVQLISSGANTYTWSPSSTLSSSTGSVVIASPSAITTYTVTGDLNGCTATAQTTITVNPIPIINVSPNDTICSGQSALLTTSGASNYLWSPPASLNLSAGANVIASPSATTTYTVTGNQNGCTATAQTTVLVNPLPTAIFTLNPVAGCSPLHVQFTDGSVTLAGSSYSWNFGDNSSSALQNPDHTFFQPATFTVSLTVLSPAGCSGSAVSFVTVYPNPVADFTASPSSAEKGTEIYFTDQSYSNIISWNWDFGDGKGVSNIQHPIYIYDSPGSFTTKLVVSNVYSCMDTASSTVIITDGEFEVWIPNVFTPNSDHRNDIFNAKGMWISKLDMTIFDRWGMEIFHTTDKEEGWNGRMHGGGADCLMDTYVYLIKAWDDKNAAHQFIGHITLLR